MGGALIDVSVAAEALGKSVDTVQRWCASGRLVAERQPSAGRTGWKWMVDANKLPAAARTKYFKRKLAEYAPPTSIPAEAANAPTRSLRVGATAVTPTTPPRSAVVSAASPRMDDRKPASAAHMTEAQRQRAAARLYLLNAAYALVPAAGGIFNAFESLARAVTTGAATPELLSQVALSNARPRPGQAARVSVTTLRRWHAMVEPIDARDAEARLLAVAEVPAPERTFADIDEDVLRVLAKYRSPNGGNLAWAIRDVFPNMDAVAANQLYHRANRAKAKMPESTFHKGRHTGAALASKQPYVKRDTSEMSINDIWVIDGHAMKGKWAHPETGKPFIPEFTCVMDVKDRFVVGWSIALSETALGVAEALGVGIEHWGQCHTLYSDIGSGEKALHNTHPVYGVYQQLNIHHMTGRPGNPQGRGVIERVWKMVVGDVERRNPHYRGLDMDPDTKRRRGKQLDKDLRAAARAGKTYDEAGNVLPLVRNLPSFQSLIDELRESIARYNARPHRSLPRHPTEPRHLSPAEYRAQLAAERPDLVVMPVLDGWRLMLKPYRIAKNRRGWVTLFKQDYFSQAMYELADGKDVRVHFDVTDASKVWIADLDGRFVCEAEFRANARSFVPVSQIDAGRLRRYQGQEKLKRAQIAEITEERAGVEAHINAAATLQQIEQSLARIEAEQAAAVAAPPDNVATISERPIFATARGRYTWLYKHPQAWGPDDAEWMQRFVQSAEYLEFEELYRVEGLGWPPAGLEGLFKVAAA
jgi:putative transposase